MPTRSSKKTVSTKKTSESISASPSKSKTTNLIKQRRSLLVLGLIILALLAFYYKGLFIAATVNGAPILRVSIVKELEKQSGSEVLQGMITEKLIEQEIKNKNIQITEEEIDKQLAQIEKTLKDQGQNFDELLAAQGLTREELRKGIRTQLAIEKMLAGDLKVTDGEIQKYMESNKENLPTDASEEELKKQVQDQIKQDKLSEKYQAFVTDLEKKAKINYFKKY